MCAQRRSFWSPLPTAGIQFRRRKHDHTTATVEQFIESDTCLAGSLDDVSMADKGSQRLPRQLRPPAVPWSRRLLGHEDTVREYHALCEGGHAALARTQSGATESSRGRVVAGAKGDSFGRSRGTRFIAAPGYANARERVYDGQTRCAFFSCSSVSPTASPRRALRQLPCASRAYPVVWQFLALWAVAGSRLNFLRFLIQPRARLSRPW